MTTLYDPAAVPGRHTLTYRIRDSHKGFPVREVEVLATPGEIHTLVRDGYLVRERLVPRDRVERLRAALEEVVARDDRPETGGGRAFGGIFLRHLADKHPAFLEMVDFPPAVSVARALFGPLVQLRGFTARICTPDTPGQETEWHFHLRLVPDPLPPMFSPPQALDALIYLDDLDDATGPFCVIPGSHRWLERDLGRHEYDDHPEQVVLRLPAGSMVLAHANLWHRALPTRPGAASRRLLLFGYSPAYMKPSIYGKKPLDGLTQRLQEDPDLSEEMRELLGTAGYM